MSIYVGNLYEGHQEDLTSAFAEWWFCKAGSATDRETGRLRGFGFVEMDTDAEEATAIDALDGAEWMGRSEKLIRRSLEDRGSSFNGSWRNNSFSSRY